jgi:3-methyl-2-oxobutanoate hydroxymethyltransferase
MQNEELLLSLLDKFQKEGLLQQMLEQIGCFGVVLEKVPSSLAGQAAKSIKVPIIGIGAGNKVDGQVLVLHDMLGMNKDFSPRFLRRYLDLDQVLCKAIGQYITDVKSVQFPNKDEQY